MAKKELQWAPLLGQYMSLSGAVFVDRANNKDALKALAAAGDDMKSKGVSRFPNWDNCYSSAFCFRSHSGSSPKALVRLLRPLTCFRSKRGRFIWLCRRACRSSRLSAKTIGGFIARAHLKEEH